jgi:hypothetical protein
MINTMTNMHKKIKKDVNLLPNSQMNSSERLVQSKAMNSTGYNTFKQNMARHDTEGNSIDNINEKNYTP